MDNVKSKKTKRFVNCLLLRDHKLIADDLWVRDGKILDPQSSFYSEKCYPEISVDCRGQILAPGFIDVQINGACGVDFSYDVSSISDGIDKVAQMLVLHGTTSFCPTIVTSPHQIYSEVLPAIRQRKLTETGAGVLGLHLEGPFISKEKKGAHPEHFIRDDLTEGLKCVEDVYGPNFTDITSIVTLAPELPGALNVIEQLNKKKVIVSMGHSIATLKQGEKGFHAGATFITHLFNAMLPFHHRDPGLVGLLTSWKLPKDKFIYFGLIADGIHTHPASLRIAHKTHQRGVVLITDSIAATGLLSGVHKLGQQIIDVRDGKAYIAGTETLCGSIATMDYCVRNFYHATQCTKVEVLEAASLHPAELLGVTGQKGTLNYGTDADFILLDDDLNVTSTYISGNCVWHQ